MIYYLLLLLLLLPGGHADPELEPGHNGGTVPEGEGSPRLHRLLQQFMPRDTKFILLHGRYYEMPLQAEFRIRSGLLKVFW